MVNTKRSRSPSPSNAGKAAGQASPKRMEKSPSRAPHASTMSKEEAQLYDRQIRLWGVEAQSRMRQAHVLLVNMGPVANEIAKNIVLAGIASLTIFDETIVTEEHTATHFLINDDTIGQPRGDVARDRLSILNPRVHITSNTTNITHHLDAIKGQKVVVATETALEDMIKINAACREHGSHFYAADTFGWFGYAFADLGDNYHYLMNVMWHSERKKQPQSDEVTRTEYTKRYTPIDKALEKRIWQGLTKRQMRRRISPTYFAIRYVLENLDRASLLQKLGLEENADILHPQMVAHIDATKTEGIVPIAAIVGGVVAQYLLKGVAEKDEPLHNFFTYSAEDAEGMTMQCL